MKIDESKLSSSELASAWFRANPLFVNPSNLLAIHISTYYKADAKKWRKDSPVKIVFGSNGEAGRISVTPKPNQNEIKVRFVPLNKEDQITSFINAAKPQSVDISISKGQSKELPTIELVTAISKKSLTESLNVIDQIINNFDFRDFDRKNPVFDTMHTINEEAFQEVINASEIRRKYPEYSTMVLNEARMEKHFQKWLQSKDIESTVQDRDGLFRRDVTFTKGNTYIIAELKYTSSTRQDIEAAIGQLLRYQLHPLAQKPGDELLIVSGNIPEKEDIQWFKLIKEKLNLPLSFLYESESKDCFLGIED
jgi:hypothetical protein